MYGCRFMKERVVGARIIECKIKNVKCKILHQLHAYYFPSMFDRSIDF